MISIGCSVGRLIQLLWPMSRGESSAMFSYDSFYCGLLAPPIKCNMPLVFQGSPRNNLRITSSYSLGLTLKKYSSNSLIAFCLASFELWFICWRNSLITVSLAIFSFTALFSYDVFSTGSSIIKRRFLSLRARLTFALFRFLTFSEEFVTSLPRYRRRSIVFTWSYIYIKLQNSSLLTRSSVTSWEQLHNAFMKS